MASGQAQAPEPPSARTRLKHRPLGEGIKRSVAPDSGFRVLGERRALLADIAAGLALAALSLRKGRVDARYGGWERAII